MELGAFDFVHKPDAKDPVQNAPLLRRSLAAKFAAYISYLEMNGELSVPDRVPPAKPTSSTTASVPAYVDKRSITKPELVVIGDSTGGPESLHTVLKGLRLIWRCQS
jgi:chemotaxis response regulator CheB